MTNVKSDHHCFSEEQFKSGNNVPTQLISYIGNMNMYQRVTLQSVRVEWIMREFYFSLSHNCQCSLVSFFKGLPSYIYSFFFP